MAGISMSKRASEIRRAGHTLCSLVMPWQILNNGMQEYIEREVNMTPQAYIMRLGGIVLSVAAFVVIGASFSEEVWSEIGRFAARDPGVRSGPNGAGGPLSDLTEFQKQLFKNGREDFEEVQSVQGEEIVSDTELGL